MQSVMHSRSASASMLPLKVDTTLTAKAAGEDLGTPVSAATWFEEDHDNDCEENATVHTKWRAHSKSDSVSILIYMIKSWV